MHRSIISIAVLLSVLWLFGCSGVKRAESQNHNSRISIIVLHFTSIDFETSLGVLTEPSSRPVSSHYLIPEPDDETYGRSRLRIHQLVDENRRAWHAGASYWRGKTGLNDQSIGIEIVNQGGCHKAPSSVEAGLEPAAEICFFPDFPDGQIALLVELLEDILERHPDIGPTNIVGHSDIAPGRKVDPGPRFPWERLARLGFGAWYDEATVLKYWQRFLAEPLPLVNLQRALAAYGYKVQATGEYDQQTGDALQSFQLHFRAHKVTRQPDVETAATLFALIEKYYPEEIEDLLRLDAGPVAGEG